jgi:hypothetical protein
MRDKRILELKAKHNFYIMPTFNESNLKRYSKKFKGDFESDTLSVYSGGGYIAKSRIASSYSKRRKELPTGVGKKPISQLSKRRTRRFNEELDSVSQK